MRRNYESDPIKARRARVSELQWANRQDAETLRRERNAQRRAAGTIPGLVRTAEQIEAEKSSAHAIVVS